MCIWQDHKNVLSTVLELFKTVRFCQWNLGGKIQAHRTLFTAGLGFESTTQMIGLWGPNCLVLRISSFCVYKASGLSVTFHLFPFSYRASLANGWLNLALTYFEKAIGNVIAAKGDRTSDLVSLYEEIAQIEQLRRNHDQAIQYLQRVGGWLDGAWPGSQAWASQNRGWDGFSSRFAQETFLNLNDLDREHLLCGPLCCRAWFKAAFPSPSLPLTSVPEEVARGSPSGNRVLGASELKSQQTQRAFSMKIYDILM